MDGHNRPARLTTEADSVPDSVPGTAISDDAPEPFADRAIVISRDRRFLDRAATHVLAFEGDSRSAFFDGNFSEYES